MGRKRQHYDYIYVVEVIRDKGIVCRKIATSQKKRYTNGLLYQETFGLTNDLYPALNRPVWKLVSSLYQTEEEAEKEVAKRRRLMNEWKFISFSEFKDRLDFTPVTENVKLMHSISHILEECIGFESITDKIKEFSIGNEKVSLIKTSTQAIKHPGYALEHDAFLDASGIPLPYLCVNVLTDVSTDYVKAKNYNIVYVFYFIYILHMNNMSMSVDNFIHYNFSK